MNGIIDETMSEEMQERFVRAMCYPPYPPALYNNHEVRTVRELQEYKNHVK